MSMNDSLVTRSQQSRPIPSIYLSYSNQSGFIERYFVVKLFEQLIKHGLDENIIWFDHHQGIHADTSATWYADRLEAIDLSLGSLLILSSTCQYQRLMTIEIKAIVDRKILSGTSSVYGLYVIFLDDCHDFAYLRSRADFFYAFDKTELALTVEERVSIILNSLLTKLLPFNQLISTKNLSKINEQKAKDEKDEEFKPICCWPPKEIQTYLTRIGVQESSREIFAEKEIDGYLLLACTENELKDYFLMTNRKIRQNLIENVIQRIHLERQNSIQWHYEAKKYKGKTDHIYIIYDPEDYSIANQISNFLREKNFRVFTHNTHFGRSKQEFLSLNGPVLARTKDVIYLLTDKSSRSTFTFHELALAEWFEKSIVTVYIENVWTNMRSSIRALLADYPSVDFIHQSLNESLSILHTYLRPQLLSSNEYVQKLKQTVRPLANIAAFNSSLKAKLSSQLDPDSSENPRFVYLSYSKIQEKWNVIHAIERLIFVLDTHHFYTGIQLTHENKTNNTTTARTTARENDSVHLPKIPLKSSSIVTNESSIYGFNRNFFSSNEIRRDIGPGDIRHCRVMIICLTPNYFHNEQCLNELRLCEIYQKPLIICLLRHMNSYRSNQILNSNLNLDEQISMMISSKMPLTTLNFLRKNIRLLCIDLTTNELFSRNAPILLRKLETILGKYRTSMEAASTNTLNPNGFSQTSEVF